MMKQGVRSGFTLSEVLIALGIIGVIAMFTLPKVFNSTSTTHQYATCKEVFNVMYTLLDQGQVTGELETDGSNFGTYFMAKIKAIKKCRSSAQVQGCWSTPNYTGQTSQPGMVLSNGAFLVGFDNTVGSQNAILLDWNGAQPPNAIGEDRLFLSACLDSAACSGGLLGSGIEQDPATIAPVSDNGDYNSTMLQSLTAAQRNTMNTTLFNTVSNVQ